VLIQVYRTSADYIPEHSNKTIDTGRCSYIVDLSLDARCTMILRTKKDTGDLKPA
jgi:alkylated DNA repair dioxygenase AlkB